MPKGTVKERRQFLHFCTVCFTLLKIDPGQTNALKNTTSHNCLFYTVCETITPVFVVNGLTCVGALVTKLSHTKTNLSITLAFCVGKAPSSTNSCGMHIAVDNFFSGLSRA